MSVCNNRSEEVIKRFAVGWWCG